MNNGCRINAILSDEDDTGRPFYCAVLAMKLHLNLYRIDLSPGVCKYIGATGRNQRRLFDKAESKERDHSSMRTITSQASEAR